ncbi:hypothetical protein HK101_008300 [Irineochytrium annulatum]|nr:hypothetical protein HK101_008300 [Irineochytrium annulatum]
MIDEQCTEREPILNTHPCPRCSASLHAWCPANLSPMEQMDQILEDEEGYGLGRVCRNCLGLRTSIDPAPDQPAAPSPDATAAGPSQQPVQPLQQQKEDGDGDNSKTPAPSDRSKGKRASASSSGPLKSIKRKRNGKEMANVVVESEQLPTDSLFKLKFALQRRDFKGQQSSNEIGTWEAETASADEFRTKLWDKVKGHRRRAVNWETVDDDKVEPQWSPVETPTFEDITKFVMLKCKTDRRPGSGIDDIDVDRLRSWRLKKDLDFENKLMKATVRDRAGAPANELLNALASELKNKHRMEFRGVDGAYKEWANWILSQPAHDREQLKEARPPREIIHLFAAVRSSAESQIHHMRAGLGVARSMGTTHSGTINEIVETLEVTMTAFEEMGRRVTGMMGQLNDVVEQHRHAVENNIINDISACMRPQESEFGRQLFDGIQEQVDVDH